MRLEPGQTVELTAKTVRLSFVERKAFAYKAFDYPTEFEIGLIARDSVEVDRKHVCGWIKLGNASNRKLCERLENIILSGQILETVTVERDNHGRTYLAKPTGSWLCSKHLATNLKKKGF